MKKICVLLLTIVALGCGYKSKNYSTMGGGGGTPTITSLMPPNTPHGGPAFTLTVNGTNFTPSSTVYWNGAPRTTTYATTMQLAAAISATDIASPGMVPVKVVTTGGVYGGGVTSNTVTFTVN